MNESQLKVAKQEVARLLRIPIGPFTQPAAARRSSAWKRFSASVAVARATSASLPVVEGAFVAAMGRAASQQVQHQG